MHLQSFIPISLLMANGMDHLVSQEASDETNLLAHLGGMGPYVENKGFGIPAERALGNLEPDKVFVFARHGERYPTKSVAMDLRRLFKKLKYNSNVDKCQDTPFAFVKDWKFFIPNKEFVGELTTYGQFNGAEDMYNFGKTLRGKYANLWNGVVQPFFSADTNRCIQSAEEFSKGFFYDDDEDWETYVRFINLPEKPFMGADSLTVGKSCKKYLPKFQPSEYVGKFLEEEADRLNIAVPGFEILPDDVYTMAVYCAFELNALGESKICDALTLPAFLDMEYSKDTELWNNYAMSPISFTLGSVYVDALIRVFEGEMEENFFFSFTHDHDVLYFLNALGVFDYQENNLSTKHIEFNRWFRASQFVPMGARVVVERYTKNGEKLIRVLVNNAVIPLPYCQSGPSFMCKLSKLREMLDVRRKREDIVKRCRLGNDVPHYLSFYGDWQDRIE